MKKVYWIILILVIVIAGVWFYMMNQSTTVIPIDNTNTISTSTSIKTGTPAPSVSANSSVLGKSFTQKGNFVCTYETVSSNAKSSYAVYMSAGKVRGEFRTTTGGITDGTIVLYDGNYVYTWKEGMGTGTIKKPSAISSITDILPADLTSGVIVGTSASNASWDCHPWLTDMKLLTKPTNMTFK